MSKVLIACGGTGGHIMPGIALAEGLTDRGHKCWLIISRKRVDERLVKKYSKFEFISAPAAPMRLHPLGMMRFIVSQAYGVAFSRGLIAKLNPDMAIAFGGFTSLGVTVAAMIRQIPFALHESNRIPGRAVRLLSCFGPERVYLPVGVRLKAVASRKIRNIGCPVRKEIQRVPMSRARIAIGMDENCKLLVILGGSQGASVLNEWVENNFDSLAHEGVSVYCVTGSENGTERSIERPTKTGDVAVARFVPFTEQVCDVLSAADLVVSRAGAGAIAELIRCRAPAILVPYPHAADNHQKANAAFFEKQGGGLVIDQSYMQDLCGEVIEVIFNDWLLQTFRLNLQRMDRENHLAVMLDDIEDICRETSARMAKRKSERSVSVKLAGEGKKWGGK